MKNKVITYFQLHFFELKYNFIIFLFLFFYIFSISYFFSEQLIFLFIKILIKTDTLKYFIFTNITEMFITNFLISLYVSSFLAFFFFLLQNWYFISEGLHNFENYKIMKFFFFFFIFNTFIILTILIKIIPNIWFFFIKINFSDSFLFSIYFEPKLNNYFNFLFNTFFLLYFLFLYFLFLYNFFRIKTMVNLRKFFHIKFLILSVFISPPDFFNQLLIFLIFLIFFEFFIFVYFFLYKYFNNF